MLRSSSSSQPKHPRIWKNIFDCFCCFRWNKLKFHWVYRSFLFFLNVFLHTSSLSSRLLAFNSVCTGRIWKDVDSVVLLTLLLSPCAFVWVWVCDVRRHTSLHWNSVHGLAAILDSWVIFCVAERNPMPLIIIIIGIFIWSFDPNLNNLFSHRKIDHYVRSGLKRVISCACERIVYVYRHETLPCNRGSGVKEATDTWER